MSKKVIESSSNEYTQSEARKRISETLGYSIKDASWWAVMLGMGEYYLSAFAVFLGASALQISILTTFPLFIASMLQLSAVKIVNHFKSRKRIVLTFYILQATMWPIIVLLAYKFKSPWLLILLATFYFTFNAMANPAWTSWIGDLVGDKQRGKFFGRRNRMVGVITFISVIGGGIFLEYFKNINEFWGFGAIFIIASFCGLISCTYISKEFEPIVEVRKPKGFTIFQFIKRMHKTPFGTFSIFIAMMNFAVYIVSPLFVIHWLQTIGFSYFQYMVIMSAAAISGFITMTYWGANADYYGNKTILRTSSYMIGIIPLLWYFTRFVSDAYLFEVTILLQLVGGFAWSGFNLSATNFIFDSVRIENRVRLMSYSNALKGVAILLGSLIGGLFANISFKNPFFIEWFTTGFFFLLILSFIVRLVTAIYFSHIIKDIKIAEKKPQFFYFAMVMPVQGVIFDSLVGMNRTIKRFKDRLMKIEKRLDYWQEDYKNKTKN